MNLRHTIDRLRYSSSKLAGMLAYKLHPPQLFRVLVMWQDGHCVGRNFREDWGTTAFTFYREDNRDLLVKRIIVSSLASGWGVLLLFRNAPPLLLRSDYLNEVSCPIDLGLLGPLMVVMLSPNALRELEAANKSCGAIPLRVV